MEPFKQIEVHTSPPILQQAPLKRQGSIEMWSLDKHHQTTLLRRFDLRLQRQTDARYGRGVQLQV